MTGSTRFHHGSGVPNVRSLATLRFLNISAFIVDVALVVVNTGALSDIDKAHPTPFSTNGLMTGLYWIVMAVWQLLFLYSLFSSDEALLTTASRGVHTHFFFFHVLNVASVELIAKHHYVWAEVMICINLINLVSLYLRIPSPPSVKALWTVQIPVVALPLATVVVDVLYTGALMVHCHSLACRILANVFIWEILALGGVLLLVFRDWTIGLALAYQAANLGVGQLFTKVIAFQWIFAFVISGILFVSSAAVMVVKRGVTVDTPGAATTESDERAPLLE